MVEIIGTKQKVLQPIMLLSKILMLLPFLASCSHGTLPSTNLGNTPNAKILPTASAVRTDGTFISTLTGKKISVANASSENYGMIVPNGEGGAVAIFGGQGNKPSAEYIEAKELKLKIRELAEQLIADVSEVSLRGVVAIPTSFVNINNFEQTSSFGQLIAEQLIYEFNQRGFPVKEFRIPKSITAKKQEGEFYLTRAIGAIAPSSSNSVVIAGTYFRDESAVFVNARIIRPSDGRVLRTANLTLNSSPMLVRMTKGRNIQHLTPGTMQIMGKADNSPVMSTNPFDQGADIHQ